MKKSSMVLIVAALFLLVPLMAQAEDTFLMMNRFLSRRWGKEGSRGVL